MRSGPISWQVRHPSPYLCSISPAWSPPIDHLCLRPSIYEVLSCTFPLLSYEALILPD